MDPSTEGFSVSDTGYFLYVDGQHVNESGMIDSDNPSQAWMRFKTAIIPFVGDDSWVEDALVNAKRTLEKGLLLTLRRMRTWEVYRASPIGVGGPAIGWRRSWWQIRPDPHKNE